MMALFVCGGYFLELHLGGNVQMRKCDARPNPMRRHFNIKPNIYFMVVRERSGTSDSAIRRQCGDMADGADDDEDDN